jgi:type IV secretory pathway VirB10-like protein
MIEQNKWAVLAVLVVAWAALIAFRVLNAPEPRRVALVYKAGQTAGPGAARAGTGVPAVVQPARAKPDQASFKTPKNIFAPLSARSEDQEGRPRLAKKRRAGAEAQPARTAPSLTPEELAAEEARRQEELARQQQELAAQQQRQQQEMARQQAQQQMAQYRFLGYLTQGGQQQAFLGKGREIFIVRAGETLEGRIRVLAIEASSIKMRDASTSVETTIPLSKGAGP